MERVKLGGVDPVTCSGSCKVLSIVSLNCCNVIIVLSKSDSKLAAVKDAPVEYTLVRERGLLARIVNFWPVCLERNCNLQIPCHQH